MSDDPKKFLLIPDTDHLSDKTSQIRKITGRILDGNLKLFELVQGIVELCKSSKELLEKIMGEINSIPSKLSALQVEVDKLKSSIEKENRGQSEEIFEEIRQDKEEFKQDWLKKQKKRPIQRQLQLYDDLDHLAKENPSLASDLSSLRTEALTVLNLLGAERIEREEESFTPNLQNAVEVEQVCTEEEDGQVEEVYRDGFQYLDGTVIRPQRVKVGKFEDSEESNEEGGSNDE